MEDSRAVTVITRTRDRPITLERAFVSVAGQTFGDFEWVIVNDGGKRDIVDVLAEKARSAGLIVRVIHIEASRGMEAASNRGLKGLRSEFFAIHDDDDSWHPDFLGRTVEFLLSNPRYKSVLTHCWRISEQIAGDTIRFISREPHQPLLDSIRISDLLIANISPPISFLYRASLLDEVGYFDEEMEVLGDWDFNLRAALAGEIGVIATPLANYHVRTKAAHLGMAYRNSVPPGDKRQKDAEVLYRNRKLREDMERGRFGLGVMLNLTVIGRPKPTRLSFIGKWFRIGKN